MIKVLIPSSLSQTETMPETLERLFVETYETPEDYKEKLISEMWDVVFGESHGDNPYTLFVTSSETLLMAIKLVDTTRRYEEIRKQLVVIDTAELQGARVLKFLKQLKDFAYDQKDCFCLVAEKGIEVEAYIAYVSGARYRRIKSNKSSCKAFKAFVGDSVLTIYVSSERVDLVPSLNIPPLRERRSDIPYIIDWLLSSIHQKYKGLRVRFPDDQDLSAFMNYSWPGNIQELAQAVYRYASGENLLNILTDVEIGSGNGAISNMREYVNSTVSRIEKELITKALRASDWNRKKASAMLGMNYKTFCYKIKKHGIKKR